MPLGRPLLTEWFSDSEYVSALRSGTETGDKVAFHKGNTFELYWAKPGIP